MSGRRWLFSCIAAISISPAGCQVDGGAPKLWNPFVRAEKKSDIDSELLPKFVRRMDEGNDNTSKPTESPIAESRVEALLAEGQRGLQENRIPEARRAYTEVLQFLPDDPTAHHGLAMAADLTENWTEAEEHYRQALRSRPRDANLLCDIGYSYLLQNRYSEAASYLEQAIQINPNHENAHANLALLDVRQGNREAARERLTKRYGNVAKVTQILAALESQPAPNSAPVTSPKTASSLIGMAPALPANASFEEVREIANRERIAAEQRRAAITVPPDHNSPIRPASAAMPLVAAGQPVDAPQSGLAQPPGTSSGSNTVPTTTEAYAAGNRAATIPLPGNYAPDTNLQMPTIAPAQFGSPPTTTSPPTSVATNPVNATNPSYAMNPAYATNPGQPLQQSPQYPATASQTPPAGSTSANPGGVISVRPSGAFQPPTQGASYGQPLGFGQPPVNIAGYPGSGDFSAPSGNPMAGNTSPGYPAGYPATNQAGQQNAYANQQQPVYGQNAAPIQLDGLNAGPGALFPIGQGAGTQGGQVNMGNVSSPGSNSVINGAMYGQPLSTLPSQEWMMQQQQQIQQLRAQPQQLSQTAQGYPGQNYNNQGYSSPPPAGSLQPNGQYAMPNTGATTTAPRPGVQTQPVNPLSSYENQLRQLDTQYNNTLQQLDPNATATVPRARY
ncbi:MAG: tetratricopeptide repeat protein [Planctomycetaceae bacterium]|nr:tetratricopeptide repeat protein [Planctomycetaceae bacterium]